MPAEETDDELRMAGGSGGGLLGQEAGPLVEGPGGGHPLAAPPVDGGHEVERQLAAGGVQGRDARFVQEGHVGTQQLGDAPAHGVIRQTPRPRPA